MAIPPVSNAALPVTTVSTVSNSVLPVPPVINAISTVINYVKKDSNAIDVVLGSQTENRIVSQIAISNLEAYINQQIQEISQKPDPRIQTPIKMLAYHKAKLEFALNNYPGKKRVLPDGYYLIIKIIENLIFNMESQSFNVNSSIKNLDELHEFLKKIAIFTLLSKKTDYCDGKTYRYIDICNCFIYYSNHNSFHTPSIRAFLQLKNIKQLRNKDQMILMIAGSYPSDDLLREVKNNNEKAFNKIDRCVEQIIPRFLNDLILACKEKSMLLNLFTVKIINACTSKLHPALGKRVLENILFFLQSIDNSNPYLNTFIIDMLFNPVYSYKPSEELSKISKIAKLDKEIIQKIAKNPNLINLFKKNPDGTFSYTQQDLEYLLKASNTFVTSIPIPASKVATQEKIPQHLTSVDNQQHVNIYDIHMSLGEVTPQSQVNIIQTQVSDNQEFSDQVKLQDERQSYVIKIIIKKVDKIFQELNHIINPIELINSCTEELILALNQGPYKRNFISDGYYLLVGIIKKLPFDEQTGEFVRCNTIKDTSQLKAFLKKIAIFFLLSQNNYYYNSTNYTIIDICHFFYYGSSNKVLKKVNIDIFLKLEDEEIKQLMEKIAIVAILNNRFPSDNAIIKVENEFLENFEIFDHTAKSKIVIPDFIAQLKSICENKKIVLHYFTINIINFVILKFSYDNINKILTKILYFLQCIDNENPYLDTSIIYKILGVTDRHILKKNIELILNCDKEIIKKIAKNPNLIDLLDKIPSGILCYTQQELEDKNIIESSPEASNISVTTIPSNNSTQTATNIPIPAAKLAPEENIPQDLTCVDNQTSCENSQQNCIKQIENIIKYKQSILYDEYRDIVIECYRKSIYIEETLVKIFNILAKKYIIKDDASAIAKKLTKVFKELPVEWECNSTKFLASIFDNINLDNLLAFKDRNVDKIFESIKTKHQISIADNNQLSNSPPNDNKKRHLEDADDSFTSNKKPKQI